MASISASVWAVEIKPVSYGEGATYTPCSSMERINYEVLKKIGEDCKQFDFRDGLQKITCPSLILKGILENSLLSNNDIADYVNNLNSKSITIEKFDNAGHDIQIDDLKKLSEIVEKFLNSLD